MRVGAEDGKSLVPVNLRDLVDATLELTYLARFPRGSCNRAHASWADDQMLAQAPVPPSSCTTGRDSNKMNARRQIPDAPYPNDYESLPLARLRIVNNNQPTRSQFITSCASISCAWMSSWLE